MADMNKTARDFYRAVEGVTKNERKGGYDTQATVRRIENGIAYVHIPGGVDETPAKLTISAKVGDVVQVRVANGRAFLVGNASAPPTDNTEAIKAMTQAGLAAEAAGIARQRADEATLDAQRAHDAADAAQTSADAAATAAGNAQQSADDAATAAENAQQSADAVRSNLQSVVSGAQTVEKAVSVMQTALEAVVDYDPDTDTTKEYFWHDANGAHVLGADSGFRNDVDSSGMRIVDVQTEKSVAEFGANWAQIGRDGESRAEITYNAMRLVDAEGNQYFRAEDLRDETGYTVVTQTIQLLTSYTSITFYLKYTIQDVVSVSNNSAEIPASAYTTSNKAITFNAQLSAGYLTIKYRTSEVIAKAFTLGVRHNYVNDNNNDGIGLNSVALGVNVEASGDNSVAQCLGTIAAGDAETAVGRYNKRHTTHTAFSVGNGTDNANRSDAFEVLWNGDTKASGGLFSNGHSSAIGTTKAETNASARTVPQTGSAMLCSVLLEAGTWIVTGVVSMPASTAAASARLNISTTASDSAGQKILYRPPNYPIRDEYVRIVETSGERFYFNVYSSEGMTIAANTAALTAIRIA